MLLIESCHVLHDVVEVRVDGVVGRRGWKVDGEIPNPEDEEADDVQDGDRGPQLLAGGHFETRSRLWPD